MLVTRGARVRTSLWAELLLVDRSFNRCRKGNKEVTLYNSKKKTLENQTDLTKMAVDFAHLDHRADIRKAETSRIPKIQSSARKQDTSLPSKKKKPRSCSPSAHNENKVHLNLFHTRTAVELARLDNRGIITKAEISRSHKTQSSVRKQTSSFAAVQKIKPRSSSPSVNNKNNEDINSIQNRGRIANSVRESC